MFNFVNNLNSVPNSSIKSSSLKMTTDNYNIMGGIGGFFVSIAPAWMCTIATFITQSNVAFVTSMIVTCLTGRYWYKATKKLDKDNKKP